MSFAACHPPQNDAPMHQLHQAILAAVHQHRQAEYELARLLARIEEQRGYRVLGYATLGEYARTALQLDGRKARALVQLARQLHDLPALDHAMANGELPWTKARELMRVVTPQNQNAWLERAKAVTSRELERHVAVCMRGDSPPPPGAEERKPARTRVVFEMDTADAQVLRDALTAMRAQLAGDGDQVEEGAVLAELARRVLHDAHEADPTTTERYVVTLAHCPSCQYTATADAEVRDTLVAEAACDSEVVDLRPGPKQGHRTRAIPPAIRRTVLHRDNHACLVPGCRNRRWLDLHHVDSFAKGGGHAVDNLVVLCSCHHRLLHEGLLSITAYPTGWLVRHADDREVMVKRSEPVGPTAVAHVGQAEIGQLAHVGQCIGSDSVGGAPQNPDSNGPVGRR